MQATKMTAARKLVICAVCIALAFLLNQVAIYRMPQGGSVTPAAMMFVTLAGYWLGPVYGITAGVAKGLLDLTTGPFIVHPIQVLLDYPLAFGALGLAGLFRKARFGLQIGYIVGVLGRFVMVFTSGLVFFSDIAETGLAASISFSFIYNITYIGPELLVTLIIISLPAMSNAINSVTKTIVSPADYAIMSRNMVRSVTAKARLASGAVMAALGGLAFVLSSHISRLETHSVTQYIHGAELFHDAPSRMARMVERNTEQIAGLQTAGVLLLALGAALVFSIMLPKTE